MTKQLLPRYLFIGLTLLMCNFATASTEQLLAPQLIIENTSQALLKKLQDPGFANNKNKIRSFVDSSIFPNVDTVRMSALVLGKHWRKANKQQKKQFIAAFKNLLVDTYSTTFTEQFQNWTIDYLPLKLTANDKKVSVKTRVKQAGKPEATIDYSMIRRNEQWKIYDIKVEGISLVISNRETFGQMIKDSGSLGAVISQLETKNQR